MAVTPIDFTDASGTASFTLDIGSAGTDRLVVVASGFEGHGTISSATCDGKAMTEIGDADNLDSVGNRTSLWAIDEAALGASSGTVTIAVSLSSTTASYGLLGASFSGVGALVDVATNTTSTSSSSVAASIDAENSGLVLGVACNGSGHAYSSATSPLGLLAEFEPSSANSAMVWGAETADRTAKSYAVNWASSANRSSMVVASFESVAQAESADDVDLTHDTDLSIDSVTVTFDRVVDDVDLAHDTDLAATSTMTIAGVSLEPLTYDTTIDAAGTDDWVIETATRDFVLGGAPTIDLVAALESAGEYATVVELLNENEEILFTTDTRNTEATLWAPAVSEIDMDRNAAVLRAVTLTLPVESDAHRPSRPTHPFRNPRNFVRIWMGWYDNDGNDTMWPLATLAVQDGSLTSDGDAATATIAAGSRQSVLDTDFADAFTISAGAENVATALAILGTVTEVANVAVFGVSAPASRWTLPATEIEAGTSKRQVVEEILDAAGRELVDDERGRLVIQPIGETWVSPDEAPRWRYGDDGIPVDTATIVWGRDPAPSAAAVTVGGSVTEDDADPLTVTVWDLDTQSETYLAPGDRGSAVVLTVDNQFVRTREQGIHVGYALLRRFGRGGGVVEITAAPNPAIRVGDTVAFSHAGAGIEDSRWRVQQVSLPPQLTGLMRLRLRGSWQPFGEDGEPPVESAPSTASIADDFNRSDSNLDGDGTNWLEVGYSFNVRSNTAVDLNADHVVAWWKEPLASSDQFAELDIAALIQSGDSIGPVVRTDGLGNGYAAIAYQSGRLDLVKLVNRQPSVVLDTWDSGGWSVSDTIRVIAEGAALSATVNGTERCTATDSSYTDRLVGMYGKASDGSGLSPGADNFAAGAV